MNTEKRDFDTAAASWDENPTRVKLAQDVAEAIKQQIAITAETKAMDFGCGTGLLSLQLQPQVGSLTGIDSSQGMLDVFTAKIARLQLANVGTRCVDLDQGGILTGIYDIIVSNMTMHHVKDVPPLLKKFHAVMAPGGWLGIADLDLDDGQFHGDNTGVFHFGFDREVLRRQFIEAGFGDVRDLTASEVVKPAANGEKRKFTVFLMTGRKGKK
jgi:2-polyprenyl-3-methyl-5-hydroxy-6-metoxy-1,4-benzoquinol methylase